MNRRSVSYSLFASVWIPAFLSLGILFCNPILAAPAGNESHLSSAVASSLSSLCREKSQAVVRIHSQDSAGEIIGTGFLIDPSGTVCTLAEMIGNGEGLSVESGGTPLPATLLSIDARTGIAFLKTSVVTSSFIPPFPSAYLQTNTPFAALASSENSYKNLPLLGVTGTRIDHEGKSFFPVPLLTAQLPNSGSRPGTPVFDLSGKFAGLVVRSGLECDSCAILPAAAVEKLHGDLLRFGRPNPGWIGAVVEEAAVPEGSSRTRIAAVEPGSPAEKGGVRPGDSLLCIGDRSIVMPQEVLESSFYLTAGQEIRLVISRGGQVRKVTLQCDPVPRTPVLTQK
jgi:S1-C subfamily serine protease